MARIQVSDLSIDETLDAKALERIRGGKGRPQARVPGLGARDLAKLLDRALSRRGEPGR